MGLRRTAGWGREEFRAVTGFDWVELRGSEIEFLVADGLLLRERGGERIRLPASGYFTSDAVFAALV